jgi:hypothetical protein
MLGSQHRQIASQQRYASWQLGRIGAANDTRVKALAAFVESCSAVPAVGHNAIVFPQRDVPLARKVRMGATDITECQVSTGGSVATCGFWFAPPTIKLGTPPSSSISHPWRWLAPRPIGKDRAEQHHHFQEPGGILRLLVGPPEPARATWREPLTPDPPAYSPPPPLVRLIHKDGYSQAAAVDDQS